MRARRIHLRHAALHRAAGVCELLRHGRKSAGQAAELVIALHSQLGRQVASGHLAHAFGQHQQGPGNLVAQNHRQQNRAKHGQKQAQRQGADVHALEAFAGQRALLVFAVGAFYGQGVGHKIGGQGALHQQKALLGGQAHAGAGNRHQGLDARAAQLAGPALFQALDPGQRTLGACGAKLAAAGLVRAELKTNRPHAGQQLAARTPDRGLGGAELFHHAREHQLGHGVRAVAQLACGNAGFAGQLVGQGIQRDPAQVQAGFERAFDLDVKPGLNRTRHELVRHHINQKPGRHTHQGKNGGDLDQQATAKAALAHALVQAHADPDNGQQQRPCHHHVEREQAGVVLLVHFAVVGGLG